MSKTDKSTAFEECEDPLKSRQIWEISDFIYIGNNNLFLRYYFLNIVIVGFFLVEMLVYLNYGSCNSSVG